ncbi:hypothetical protein AB0I34_30505 [Kribbella sp. NPDC050281]|uniref:hypothetical protein n=1 Tax=Kribbella sp. NPDC050281 TaxID=3155515 RepID=UPI0033C456CE
MTSTVPQPESVAQPPADSTPEESADTPQPANLSPVGGFLSVLLVLWLAMNEISLLSAGFLTTTNTSWAFNEMVGPQDRARADEWHSLLTQEQLPDWQHLLTGYLVLDLFFIATYTFALYRLVPKRWIWSAVYLIPAVDLAENILMFLLGQQRCTPAGGCDIDDGLITGLAWLTGLKWMGFVALVAIGLAKVQDRPLRRIVRALYIQRFSLLAFLPIAVLAVVPGSSVLDQMPDVQRRWLDGGTDSPSEVGGLGLGHAELAAFVYFVILLPTIFALGRLRADWAVRRVGGEGWPFFDEVDGTAKDRRYDSRPWVLGPALLLAGAGLVELTNRGTVFWPRLLVFCAIPLAVVVFSRLVRGWPERHPRKLRPIYPEYPADVMTAGDALAVASLSLAGLGMIRAFSGLTALDRAGMIPSPPPVPPLAASILGAVLAVGPWLVAGPFRQMIADWTDASGKRRRWIGRFLTPGMNTQENSGIKVEPHSWTRLILLCLSIALYLVLAIWPREIGDVLGVLAATTLAMTALVTMVGVLVVFMQDRQPPEIFQIGFEPLRTRSTPIITLLLIAVLATGLAGGRTDIHPVTADGLLPDRPTLQQAFDAWLKQNEGCSIGLKVPAVHGTHPGDQDELTVRPMLMMAAEGGGIRAAYWTASALGRIAKTGNGCGKHSALFSAGASGGALGLSLARFTADPNAAATSIAGHEALGAATISLVTADLLASTTGLRFATDSPHRDPTRQPLDRAGLMETTWEEVLAGIRTPFLAGDSTTAANDGPKTVTGQLILNSTAVRDGCLALVSQVDLNAGFRTADGAPLCGSDAAGPHNYDLFGAYGRRSSGEAKQCVGNLPALAATMLANRFPYVTPSGTIEGCRGLDPAQLVDGGYTDNTGLGTIVDLAPQWTKIVRDHNAVVATRRSGQFVVPVVVYIENGTGPDYSTGQAGSAVDDRVTPGIGTEWQNNLSLVPEGVVPLVTKFVTAKGDSTDSNAMLTAVAEQLDQLCTPFCDEIRSSQMMPRNVFVIRQSKQPSLSAPLGWVLSATSQSDLNDDLTKQADNGCPAPCYPTLRDLTDILQPPSKP